MSILNTMLSCSEGEHFSQLFGRRLGATIEEIRRNGFVSEAVAEIFRLRSEWPGRPGRVAYHLRVWLYRTLIRLELEVRLQRITFEGESVALYIGLGEPDRDYPEEVKCPLCGRWFTWYDAPPVCCGVEVVNEAHVGVSPWFRLHGLTPWEVKAATHPLGVADGY